MLATALALPSSFVRILRLDHLAPEYAKCVLDNGILFLRFLLFLHFLLGFVLCRFCKELNLDLKLFVQDLGSKVFDDVPVFPLLDKVFLKAAALDADHKIGIRNFHELAVSERRGKARFF